jgi:hypothetical protein
VEIDPMPRMKILRASTALVIGLTSAGAPALGRANSLLQQCLAQAQDASDRDSCHEAYDVPGQSTPGEPENDDQCSWWQFWCW